MKILYISNDRLVNETDALLWFKLYCEPSDLILKYDLTDAKEFLGEYIIKQQKHIDLIITDWNFQHSNAKVLLNWLRNSSDNYSANNFMFRSIPVLLIEDKNTQSSSISDGFDDVVKDFPTNHEKLRLAIKNVVKSWRYSLANDLDLIGLDPQTQKIYSEHRKSFISYYKLKVLSQKFVDDKSKPLNYIWANNTILSLNESNQMFSDKMDRTIINPPKYLEKEFHDFFRKNPTFIKGEDYYATEQEMLYEKHFYKNGTRKYDEPDFINKPFNYSLNAPEVFEIKRQSQKLIRSGSETFISKTKQSFAQVSRYKQYMTSADPQNLYYIKKHLGQLYTSFEYTLLMGSKNEKLEHEDLIERLKSDFDFDDINLITYEELLDKHVRLCNRLDEFNIF